MASIYARGDGTIAHVWPEDITFSPDVGTTLVIKFDEETYEAEFTHISDNVTDAFWDGSELLVNGVVYLTSTWIAEQTDEVEAEVEESSFVSAMKPILRAWHIGTQDTSTALSNIQTVLNNHTRHRSVMNGQVWPATRLIVNPVADVPLGGIIGNANAEAAYLMALFDYVTRVETFRKK